MRGLRSMLLFPVSMAAAAVALCVTGCDLFRGADSLINVSGGNKDAVTAPESSVVMRDGEIRFSYKPGNDVASRDIGMRSAMGSSRAASGFVPGMNSDGDSPAVNDLEEAINTIQMTVINTAYPDEVADMDEAYDPTGAALNVSVSVQRGAAYHVLLLLGNKDSATSTDRTLLKSGYVYLTTNSAADEDNVLKVPLYPIVTEIFFLKQGTPVVSQGKLVKRLGINSIQFPGGSATQLHFMVGSGVTPSSDNFWDQKEWSVGGNGLYALQEAEWMLANATTGDIAYDGNGTVHFYDQFLRFTNDDDNRKAIDWTDNRVSPTPTSLMGFSGRTPFFSVPLPGIERGNLKASGSVNYEFIYYPFGKASPTTPADGDPWGNYAVMKAWAKLGGFGSSWVPPCWTIRNGLNNNAQDPDIGFVGDSGAAGYGNGGVPVIIVPSDPTQLPPGIYEGDNYAPAYGSSRSYDRTDKTNALTGSPGDLNAGLAFLDAFAPPYGNYTIRIGYDIAELAPNTSLASYTNLVNKGITLTIDGVGGMKTLTLTGNGSLFAQNEGVTWRLGQNITTAVGEVPYTGSYEWRYTYGSGTEIRTTYLSANPRQWRADNAGIYTVEMWGAQGGDNTLSYNGTPPAYGGKGGYLKISLYLNIGDTFDVRVGEMGNAPSLDADSHFQAAGTWGGGGGTNSGSTTFPSTSPATFAASGGGATWIALNRKAGDIGATDVHDTILAIAGGGGGAGGRGSGCYGGWGSGGPIAGTAPVGAGVTQDGGQGAQIYTSDGTADGVGTMPNYYGGGGGGGWKGGVGGGNDIGGGGGCGYVNSSLASSSMALTVLAAKAGNETFPSPNGNGAMEVGHSGNGYVRIRQIQ